MMDGFGRYMQDDKEPIKTGAHLRQIAEIENPTLRDPRQQIESLLMTVQLTQDQLHEALRIINFRDRQIFAAMDALEDVGSSACAKGNGFSWCAHCAASDGIAKMREIHKESLT